MGPTASTQLEGRHHAGKLSRAGGKSLQSCPTLCDPIDASPPGSPVPGILQARTLEWVAISFSNAPRLGAQLELRRSGSSLGPSQ